MSRKQEVLTMQELVEGADLVILPVFTINDLDCVTHGHVVPVVSVNKAFDALACVLRGEIDPTRISQRIEESKQSINDWALSLPNEPAKKAVIGHVIEKTS